MNTYPRYYNDIEKIQMKDVMTQFFGVNESGVLTYGLEDVCKTAGHICPAVLGAYLMTQKALSTLTEYYRQNPCDGVCSFDDESGLMYRGGIKVAMSGAGDSGLGNNAMANVLSFITGAKGADGFRVGPDFPFANRANLLSYDAALAFDPKEGIEVIFTSMIASHEKQDEYGNWIPATLEACQGTWGTCREVTADDISVKLRYRFQTPEIIGDPSLSWVEKVHTIIKNVDKAITVDFV